jgi:hypothetical protein
MPIHTRARPTGKRKECRFPAKGRLPFDFPAEAGTQVLGPESASPERAPLEEQRSVSQPHIVERWPSPGPPLPRGKRKGCDAPREAERVRFPSGKRRGVRSRARANDRDFPEAETGAAPPEKGSPPRFPRGSGDPGLAAGTDLTGEGATPGQRSVPQPGAVERWPIPGPPLPRGKRKGCDAPREAERVRFPQRKRRGVRSRARANDRDFPEAETGAAPPEKGSPPRFPRGSGDPGAGTRLRGGSSSPLPNAKLHKRAPLPRADFPCRT